MLFNSFQFLVFFIVVTTTYFALPHKYRWFLLLMSSCYFYMAFVPIYILILGFTIVIDYFAGVYLEKTKGKKRKLFLIASLIANIGVLAVFKYYNFLNHNLTIFLSGFSYQNPIPFLSILLPIGLSFHTFQAMSYTIEVYRGKQAAEKNFGIYALYVMFYPQLVAGPIERPQNLIHQFYEKHSFDYQRVIDGLKLMAWGMFKKIVIADRLSILVNTIYNDPTKANGVQLIISTVFFSFQIYCDFSGYSDIAIGAAKVMGFKLMTNFNMPYFSKTITEFWTRWHISLSTWFKDYLYIPLGGSRVSKPRMFFNLIFVFVISGFWHGANYTFLIWGGIHGVVLIIEKLVYGNKRIKEFRNGYSFSNIFRIFLTYVIVLYAWVFFRAKNVHDAFYIIRNFFNFNLHDILLITHSRGVENLFGMTTFDFFLSFFFIGLLLLFDFLMQKKGLIGVINSLPLIVRWSIYISIFFIILWFGKFGMNQFIYYQF